MLSSVFVGVLGALLIGAVGIAQASTPPTASIGGSSEVEIHSAKVEGTIHSEGVKLEECFFENSAGAKVVCEPSLTEINSAIEGGSTEVPVAASLTGLEPEEHYSYKLAIKAEGQQIVSESEGEFTTAQRATVTTEAASDPQAEGATLNGQITPQVNGKVEYHFEYGKSVGEYSTPTVEFTGEQGIAHPVAPVPVAGLEPHVEYHFQLVALVEGHTITGPEATFTTGSAKPLIPANTVLGQPTRTTASIAAEINPQNEEARYTVEYEASGIPRLTTPTADIASQSGPAKVTQTLEELKPGTVYHYRIVATNEGGTTVGPEGFFETAPPQPASVVSESALAIAQTTATISAAVDPNGLPASYALEVGTEVLNGQPIYSTQSFGQLPEGSEPQTLTLSLTNLLPGTIYHYRIVVTNEEGPTPGGDATFATPGFASPIVEPPHPQIVPIPPEEKPLLTPAKHEETRAQKLAKALKQCTKQPERKQAACRKKAEKQYGPRKASKKKKK